MKWLNRLTKWYEVVKRSDWELEQISYSRLGLLKNRLIKNTALEFGQGHVGAKEPASAEIWGSVSSCVSNGQK